MFGLGLFARQKQWLAKVGALAAYIDVMKSFGKLIHG